MNGKHSNIFSIFLMLFSSWNNSLGGCNILRTLFCFLSPAGLSLPCLLESQLPRTSLLGEAFPWSLYYFLSASKVVLVQCFNSSVNLPFLAVWSLEYI